MAFEQIGLEAVLRDEDFQRGLKGFTDGVDQMSNKADKGASAISKIGSIAQGAVVAGMAAATAAIAGFVAVAKTGLDVTLDWAEDLDKLGDQFGMTGEQATKWTVAMKHVGLTVEEGAQGLNFFTRGLAETTKTSAKGVVTLTPFGEALQKLGVKAYDAKGKLKSFDQVMPEIMDAFQKLPAGVDASALSMELFGARGGSKFLDFLRQGSKGLKDAEKFAKEFGLELSTDTVNAAEEFGFAMNDLQMAMQGIWNQIGQAVLPAVKDLTEYLIKEVLPVFAAWAKEYAPLITDALRRLGEFVTTQLLPIFKEIANAVQNGDFGRLGEIVGVILEDLLARAGDVLGRLLKSFTDWVNSPATQSALQLVGYDIANWVKSAMWELFGGIGADTGPGTVGGALIAGLEAIVQALTTVLVNIGFGMGQSIVDGIAVAIESPEAQEKLGHAMWNVSQQINQLLRPGGIFEMGWDEVTSRAHKPGYQTEPGQYRIVPGAMNQPVPAIVHGGEIIYRPAGGSSTTNYNLNFSHSWNGGGASFDQRVVAQTAEDAAYRALRRVIRG